MGKRFAKAGKQVIIDPRRSAGEDGPLGLSSGPRKHGRVAEGGLLAPRA